MSVQGNRKGFFEEREGGPNGRVVNEWETFTCGHCCRVVAVPHGAKLGEKDANGKGIGEFCLTCMSPICVGCNQRMNLTRRCDPFQKKLDRAYARQRLFDALKI